MRSKLDRLRHCISCLGLINGFKYWRLQNQAIADPDIVLTWCDNWRREAFKADDRQDYLLAGCLLAMIDECEHLRVLSKSKK